MKKKAIKSHKKVVRLKKFKFKESLKPKIIKHSTKKIKQSKIKTEKISVKAEKSKVRQEKTVDVPRIKGEFIETSVDKLLDLIDKQGKVSTRFAARALGYPRLEIEEWAKALAEHGLIEVNYDMFFTILRKKSVKK